MEHVHFSFLNSCALYQEMLYKELGFFGPTNVTYLRCHDIQAHIVVLWNEDTATKHDTKKGDNLDATSITTTSSDTGTGTPGKPLPLDTIV